MCNKADAGSADTQDVMVDRAQMKGLKIGKIAGNAERKDLIPVVRNLVTAEKAAQEHGALARLVALAP